jgi:Zn-dependent peptidase ImmA (M78 family)
MDIISIFHDFCTENDLSIKLSHDMPSGYETAYGTYDVTVNTLFLNMELLKDAPEYEVLFFLFHELRHAVQYHHPQLLTGRFRKADFMLSYTTAFATSLLKMRG